MQWTKNHRIGLNFEDLALSSRPGGKLRYRHQLHSCNTSTVAQCATTFRICFLFLFICSEFGDWTRLCLSIHENALKKVNKQNMQQSRCTSLPKKTENHNKQTDNRVESYAETMYANRILKSVMTKKCVRVTINLSFMYHIASSVFSLFSIFTLPFHFGSSPFGRS